MKYDDLLEIAANCAAILTAVVATVAYWRFVIAGLRRQWALEAYLREKKLRGHDEGRRTVLHLMASLGLTEAEAEVLNAGFQSRNIRVVPGVDDQGRAARLYFEYVGGGIGPPTRF